MSDFPDASGDFYDIHDYLIAGDRGILLQQGLSLDRRLLLRVGGPITRNYDCSEQQRWQT